MSATMELLAVAAAATGTYVKAGGRMGDLVLAVTEKRESADVPYTFVRVTRQGKFVSHYGYRPAALAKLMKGAVRA